MFKPSVRKVVSSVQSKAVVLSGIVAGTVASSYSGASMALSTANNTAITTAFESGEVTVGIVAAGVILIAAAMTALGLVYNWLKK